MRGAGLNQGLMEVKNSDRGAGKGHFRPAEMGMETVRPPWEGGEGLNLVTVEE